ncbi:unnamed protein product [Closterium sp. Naga37s-1]|nr:unnamed protein product [Closterium sp. Naga37s-1]
MAIKEAAPPPAAPTYELPQDPALLLPPIPLLSAVLGMAWGVVASFLLLFPQPLPLSATSPNPEETVPYSPSLTPSSSLYCTHYLHPQQPVDGASPGPQTPPLPTFPSPYPSPALLSAYPCAPLPSFLQHAGLEEAVREVRFSLAADPINGLLGGALAGALFGRLRGRCASSSLASDPTNGLLGGALAGALFGRLRGESVGSGVKGWDKRVVGKTRVGVGRVREVRFSLASDPTNGLLGGALAGALFGRLRGEKRGRGVVGSRDIAIRAAVMFGLAGAGHRATVESFKEWRIQQLLAARVAGHTGSPHSSHAAIAAERDEHVTAALPASHAHVATDTDGRVTATDGGSESTAATAAASPAIGGVGKQGVGERGVGERGVGERGVGERGDQAGVKAGGRWEWPEWLPVRRLGEEEVKRRQEEFRQRVAAAQRLEMAGSGREAGIGGAEGRKKGE